MDADGNSNAPKNVLIASSPYIYKHSTGGRYHVYAMDTTEWHRLKSPGQTHTKVQTPYNNNQSGCDEHIINNTKKPI